MTDSTDPTRGTAAYGFPQGIGPNQQMLMVWDLRPIGDGPPVQVKMHSVDAHEVVRNLPTRYRYAFPGDPTPARAPYTAEELANETVRGKIAKLERERSEAHAQLDVISSRLAAEAELLREQLKAPDVPPPKRAGWSLAD